MARRPDPERIRRAREAATRNRLLSAGELPRRVDELLAAWAVRAVQQGLDPLTADYWTAATDWLEARTRYHAAAGTSVRQREGRVPMQHPGLAMRGSLLTPDSMGE